MGLFNITYHLGEILVHNRDQSKKNDFIPFSWPLINERKGNAPITSKRQDALHTVAYLAGWPGERPLFGFGN